jgi:hypothetical protein
MSREKACSQEISFYGCLVDHWSHHHLNLVWCEVWRKTLKSFLLVVVTASSTHKTLCGREGIIRYYWDINLYHQDFQEGAQYHGEKKSKWPVTRGTSENHKFENLTHKIGRPLAGITCHSSNHCQTVSSDLQLSNWYKKLWLMTLAIW